MQCCKLICFCFLGAMSHMRYNVERDLVDFWETGVYDNVVNQPNHTKNTIPQQNQPHNKSQK